MRNNDLYKKRRARPSDAPWKKDVRPDEADRVLAAFEDALAGGGDPGLLLKEWIAQYPTLASDLALAASAFSAQAPVEARSEDIPAPLIDKVVAEVPIPSGAIHERARRSGIAFPEGLAAQLRVSPAFLERLQRYEIDSGTIPKLFSARMAKILKIPTRECVRMLLGTLQFKPNIGEGMRADQVSFKQALRESLSPEDAAYWLEQTD